MSIMNDEEKRIIEVCNTSESMLQASRILKIPYTTLHRKALKLGVWKSNQAGKGISKPIKRLEDVFEGRETMTTLNLKRRVIAEDILEEKCDSCGIGPEWNGKILHLEMDHINGDSKDNRLENLRILCPNCHSQTPTFRGRKTNL